MTKLAIMSDLHIDVNHFGNFELETLVSVLKTEKIAHLHIAGDLSNDFRQITRPFLDALSQDISLSYNLGNHDMLGMTERAIQTMDGQVIDLESKSLVHLAGWYDYGFNTSKTESEHLASKNFYWFDRKLDRGYTDIELAEQSLQKLEDLLQHAQPSTIVAMHFVPHASFIPVHPYFARFSAFLGSPKFHKVFLKYGIKNVVFGHLHHKHDEIIDGIHYQARPLGYKREWQMVQDFLKLYPHYVDGPTYELAKRYRTIKDLPEFQTFYREHLAKEFRQSMTIFH
ncbi:metallophosphoesterase [Streptococcus merionis]|uniref:Serine/threonine protein phosphatase family protein n=1 Tax=Streptococcus merionis TaxID=400065 RepID=A0A239SSQ6_9STRE|nr:metallophosphoesterase [Streptococcus merionis]SNU88386.1 serine/threonine protein phosphatase family protein [Streptococcus merionis]